MNPTKLISWPGAPLALASAALFGASTPLAKLLLGAGVSPWLLAGLLYLGSGIGLGIWLLLRRGLAMDRGEASLRRNDLSWLALVVIAGGIAGPLLLMLGLARTSAASAALLLNLEGLATMAIAWTVFRENVDRWILTGAVAILAGAVLLSWGGTGAMGWGALLIAAACVAWGIDNNLTRKLSNADPVQIAAAKGIAAGLVNLTFSLMAGAKVPPLMPLVGAALIGFFGYGVSLVFFVRGLRHLGSARTGAYFSTAPFIGAVLAVFIFQEPITYRLLAAALLMAFGVGLHLVERHEHPHVHDALDHEHRHVHDQHHRHRHSPGDPPGEPHTHWHKHIPLAHAHAHYPDPHHRHGHDLGGAGGH